MKMCIKKLFLLPALIAGLGLILTGRVSAQTYTNLHLFMNYPNDGANPQAGLILSGNTLYGTASGGGNSSSLSGTVFKINTDGSGFTNLYYFTPASYPNYPHTNSDGASPQAGLILSGNTLYGTANIGGSFGYGTVFAVNTNGSNFKNLYTFTNGSDGALPEAGLILSGNTLYGTASEGGSQGVGTVFAVNTNGTNFTTLYSFTNGSDGALPFAGLILSGKTLYGTAEAGGNSGAGTVFAVNTNGFGFTNLYDFTAADFDTGTNSDGANPFAGLILSGNTLYGTANTGGSAGNGTVFAVNTDGSNFTNLYTFTAFGDYGPNSDGALPQAGLILLGNTLYGTASYGGSAGNGTVFAINTDGTGFTNLYSFDSAVNSGGDLPLAGLILSGSTLYGTTFHGGDGVDGTVFGLSVTLPGAPQLTIIPSGTNVILTWPTNATVFTLQSTTNLVSPASWSAVSPAPVSISGQNAVTNPISGTRKFYRLSL